MLIPLLTLFLVASIVWLAIGVKGRKKTALLALNVCWWLGPYFGVLCMARLAKNTDPLDQKI